jgi:phosphate-selective porin
MKVLSRALVFLLPTYLSLNPACSSERSWQSYAQLRYTKSEDKGDYLSLRRLKLFGQGPLSGNSTYYVQFLYKANNKSPTDDRIVLQDAYASLPLRKGKLTVGQFKPPFGMERFTADAVLALIDRSQPTDRLVPNSSLGWSFSRARGAQIEQRIGRNSHYALGVFEGNGANQPFDGNGPLVVGRFKYQPPPAEPRCFKLELALSWRKDHDIDFLGQLPGAPLGYAHFAGTDFRQNLAIAYDFGNNSLRSEYFAAQYHSDKPALPSINARGYYLQWAYSLSNRWSVASRFEILDPDRSFTNPGDASWLTIGATYFMNADFHKIQANYLFRSESVSELDNDVLLVQYQRFF